MSSWAKLFGCSINVEAEEEGSGDSSIAMEVSRSVTQPNGEAMSIFECFPPLNPMEIGNCNSYFRFPESNSDSVLALLDSEPEFIDFFDRESYEVETLGEFHRRPNQRVSTPGAFNLWEFDEIELGLGIGIGSGSGSGSGQLRGDSDRVGNHSEIDSGRVEVGPGVSPVWEAMVVDEELEWEDLQNAINWVQEPPQVSIFSVEEEEEVEEAFRDADQHLDWDVLLAIDNAGLLEESEDIIVDSASGLMDLDLGVYLATIDEDYEDYNALIGQIFDNEDGIMGSPPASKSVVDDLPVVEITSEELSNGNVIVCAICKDDIVVEEKVKRLPCRHYYHGECIIPWLGIRNTCPVCRYELPTDDLEYEMNRTLQRVW